MPIMSWDESLDVKVDAMNAEHRDILDAMNRIYEADERGRTGPAINEMVEQLGKVTTRHFRDEEAFMQSIGFPDLGIHKTIHAKLLSSFQEHAARIEAAGGKADKAFFQFLQYWLSAHIKGIDRKYGDFAQARGR